MSKDANRHQVTGDGIQAVAKSFDGGDEALRQWTYGQALREQDVARTLSLPANQQAVLLAQSSWTSSGFTTTKSIVYLPGVTPLCYLVLVCDSLLVATHSPVAAALVYNSMPYRNGMEVF